ncbi:hypothetical protein SAMN04487783_1233 [Agrococcus baldri]|uniref:Uncharacterized protein n=1 Tax=Agrococcus baldri TaxID=153730 RepID=A0AA94KZC2_9MICO|nr:hypothetical protein [Agrococcus baldri]SFS09268.1 hypothetical protein SAMN04487783_1233 [Agrococcus baldri]
MRHPDHFHQHTDHSQSHEGEQPERGGHSRGHGCGHEGHGPGREGRGHEGHVPTREGHEEYGQPGRHPRGGTHRRPTLERSIMKSARRIRRSGLAPEQLHRRIAATVSHADYLTTLRTLRRIGIELRSTQPGAAAGDHTAR